MVSSFSPHVISAWWIKLYLNTSKNVEMFKMLFKLVNKKQIYLNTPSSTICCSAVVFVTFTPRPLLLRGHSNMDPKTPPTLLILTWHKPWHAENHFRWLRYRMSLSPLHHHFYRHYQLHCTTFSNAYKNWLMSYMHSDIPIVLNSAFANLLK